MKKEIILGFIKRIAITVLIVVAIVAGWLYFQSYEPKITNQDSAGRTIIALGDSLTAGNGSTEGKDYVSVLSRKLGKTVTNAGISGNTTADALARIDTVLRNDPKLVIVLLGGNDALQKVPKETTFKNLREIVAKVHAKGSMVALIGVQGSLFNDRYEAEFAAIGREANTILVPNIMSGILGREELMYDAIHPNDKGYEIVATRIYDAIKDYVK